MNRRAEWALLGTTCALLLMGLAAVELWLRSRELRADADDPEGIWQLHRYSERLGWEPRPGANGLVWGARVSINRDGYRGAWLPRERTAGRRRIAFLGDSLTYGMGVADEHTFAARLAALDLSLEAMNWGVQGYGTDQELILFRMRVRDYRPDDVVVSLCLANDFRDNAARYFVYDFVHPKPYFVQRSGELVLEDAHLRLSGVDRFLRVASDHVFLVRALLARAGAAREPVPLGQRGSGEGEALTYRLMKAFRDEVAGTGARFRLLLFPIQPGQRLAAHAERFRGGGLAGGELVDMGERLAAPEAFSRFFLDEYCHLTERGHRATALTLRGDLGLGP